MGAIIETQSITPGKIPAGFIDHCWRQKLGSVCFFLFSIAIIVSSATGQDTASGSKEGKLTELINAQTEKLLPEKTNRHEIFDAYVSKTSPDVAWGSAWMKAVDFSGIAWDNPRTLTLVSPRHAMMARHYQRKIGSNVIFHDRRGRPVTRKINGIENLGNDIAVVILDKDVPPTVKTYRLLPPSESYSKLLRGSHALITSWANGTRKVHIHSVFSVFSGLVTFVDTATLPSSFFNKLIKGDSGNPSFLWLNNEPILIGTHTYGGSGRGPFFSTNENFSDINAAMLKLSKSQKAPPYQLKTVPLSLP